MPIIPDKNEKNIVMAIKIPLLAFSFILNIDETMGDLAGLDYGECAEAEDAASDWMVKCTLSEGMK